MKKRHHAGLEHHFLLLRIFNDTSFDVLMLLVRQQKHPTCKNIATAVQQSIYETGLYAGVTRPPPAVFKNNFYARELA